MAAERNRELSGHIGTYGEPFWLVGILKFSSKKNIPGSLGEPNCGASEDLHSGHAV